MLLILSLYVAVVVAGSAPALETTSPPMPRISKVTPALPVATPTPTALPTPVLTQTEQAATTIAITSTLAVSPTRKANWQWPIRNGKLIRTFTTGHPAWDMGGQMGLAVTAVTTGTVRFADWNDQGYGYLVIVDHDEVGVQTWYAHLQYIVVKPKQTVYPGDQLGVMGGSGNAEGGWHLHFEVRENNQAVDPAQYLVEGGSQ